MDFKDLWIFKMGLWLQKRPISRTIQLPRKKVAFITIAF
jgi:hypothetical protein